MIGPYCVFRHNYAKPKRAKGRANLFRKRYNRSNWGYIMAGKPRILVITGTGKGKTTAALGIILRSLAAGKKVLLTRFCKAAPSGEVEIFSKMDGITMLSGDCGRTPQPEHPDFPRHLRCARDLFEKTLAAETEYDLIVLDEICGVTARNMIAEDEVVAFLEGLRPGQAAVLTGRGAGEKLVRLADTVSEIHPVKHAMDQGIMAQEGIEY